jgi:hypothetical protein
MGKSKLAQTLFFYIFTLNTAWSGFHFIYGFLAQFIAPLISEFEIELSRLAVLR